MFLAKNKLKELHSVALIGRSRNRDHD